MEKPYYGGPSWHIFSNLITGIFLLVIALYGGLFEHPLLYLLLIPSIYFFINAFRWRRGEFLEERLRIRDELIKFVKPRDGDRVLDVGTGAGLLAIGFAKVINEGEIIGIDRWIPLGGGTSLKTALKNAKLEGVSDKVKFVEGDARNIPYPDNYFDIVVSSFVIHIIRKGRDDALKEMIRVLKPGGKFAIVEPKREIWTGWIVDDRLISKLSESGLRNIKLRTFTINYPKKRDVYIIYGEKTEI